MGTYYAGLKISSGEVGGAVAEAVLHDIRLNQLGLQGFPQISVHRTEGRFQILLSFGDKQTEISLADNEAVAAVKAMRERKSYYEPVFDRIQHALARLEHLVINT